MTIIICLILFQLKHYLVDFHLQTQDQIKTKGIYGNLVGLGHTLEHTLGTTMVLIPFLWLHPVVLLACSLFDTFVHYNIDWTKMHYGTKDITKTRFWHQLGQDQLAHQLTYLFIAAIVVYFA
jgi:hypothetical protein